MQNNNKKIVITGGGTGGHVFPALAIADELKGRGWEIAYVGTSRGMEAKLVPERGFRFYSVQAGAVKNQGPLKILKSLWQLFGSTLWAVSFLKKEKPRIVLGVGGYVSFPISFAAFLLRIPLCLQEQNVSVGISNRILGKLSSVIFLGFEEAKSYFPPRKCTVTGNPLRSSFYERAPLEYKPDLNRLFIMGGSQGARAINDAVVGFLPKLRERYTGISVIHQTGNTDFERIQDAYRKLATPLVEIVPFIADMRTEYEKASLVISRSGALSVSELIHFGRPAIFIPYPRAGQNDQTANAALLQDLGAARVVEQGPYFNDRLWDCLVDCLNPTTLRAMSSVYRKIVRGNAAISIADLIEKNVL